MNPLILKDYQAEVLNDLESFVQLVVEKGNIAAAFRQYWLDRGIVLGHNNMALKPYVDTVPGVPRVTSKVPTAGGKTFIACNAISTIFNNLPDREVKVVAWFVPSDTILEQTLEKLRDVNHPYRQKLDSLFNGRVVVVDKESALMGNNISPTEVREQLTVFVLSAASFIDANRGDLGPRVYRDNGFLEEYANLYDSLTKKVKGSGVTGLIQVISYLNPLVIVDESHNFTADLRVKMLNDLNPCFIYELTATPRPDANIISFIGADKLKRANMVKLPVIVHNDRTVDAVIQNSITLRENLEIEALKEEKAGGAYIRPIVLFQAQPNISDDSETFSKIKTRLIEQFQIPEEQIKIKTANINELKGENLMSRSCPVRYIITINALKEGWDCPFAYILASLASRTSRIDVEQILGRILRQPYAKKHKATFLNLSYTFTCSNDFQDTLDNIIKSLNRSGYSSRDYRTTSAPIKNNIEIDPEKPTQVDELFSLDNTSLSVQEPYFSNLTETSENTTEDNSHLTVPGQLSEEQRTELRHNSTTEIDKLLSSAESQAALYDTELEQQEKSPTNSLPVEVATQADVYNLTSDEAVLSCVKDIKLPQFSVYNTSSIFGSEDFALLEKELLLEGFDLDTQDSNINFDPTESATRIIDLDASRDYAPAQGGLNENALNLFRKYYMTLQVDGKIRELRSKIIQGLNFPGISDGKISSYINKVLQRKNNEELVSLAANLSDTTNAFKNKIKELANKYREQRFFSLLAAGQIFVHPNFEFPTSLIIPKICPTLVKSLYREEEAMDKFEYRVIQKVSDLDNVLFWHRNREGKGFRINGFINHYPDFIIVTKNGNIVILETKGEHLDNPDTERKIKLGNAWATTAGGKYRYFMVFDNVPTEGAFSLNNFISILSKL